MPLTYSTGVYHPAPDMEFNSIAQVWGVIRYLDVMKRLVDIVCCNKEGDILDAPYNETMVVGIIEEKVGDSPEPRRWILQS